MQIIANGERQNWMLSLAFSAWHVLYEKFSHDFSLVFVSAFLEKEIDFSHGQNFGLVVGLGTKEW